MLVSWSRTRCRLSSPAAMELPRWISARAASSLIPCASGGPRWPLPAAVIETGKGRQPVFQFVEEPAHGLAKLQVKKAEDR